MIRYVGIDLHKHLIVGCILDEAGEQIDSFRIDEVTAESLDKLCKKHLRSEDHVVMEATTHVWAVDRVLSKHVAKVVVSNPMLTKAIACSTVKTDKVDAKVLAQLLRSNFLPTVWKPDEETSRLREISSRRARVVRQRTQIINRIRSVLAIRLLDCPHPVPSQKGREWLQEVAIDEDGRWMIDSDLRMLDCIEKEIDECEARIAKAVHQNQNIKLLMTLPGVSTTVAVAVLSAIGDIKRFEKPEKLASYFGLVTSTRQSASKCYHGSITKAGNVHARWSLVQAAHTASRDLGPLGHFFNKLRRRKAYNSAVTALARKLAELCWHLLTTQQPYRYAKPSSVQEKLAKLRVLATGVKRKGGLGKGVDSRTRRQEGDLRKRCGGLDDVLQSEGLPKVAPIPEGERRHLEHCGLEKIAEEVQKPVMRKRRCITKLSEEAHLDFAQTAPKESLVG